MKSEFLAGDRHVLRAFREAPGYLLAATLRRSEKHAVGFVRLEGVILLAGRLRPPRL